MNPASKPPSARTPLWAAITKAAREKRFVLQVCGACGAVQYPPREVCFSCLSETLDWCEVNPQGIVLTCTDLHASINPFFQSHVPWYTGMIQLACGPRLLAHLAPGARDVGCKVTVIARLDSSGQGVFIAVPRNTATPLEDVDFTALLAEHKIKGETL